MDLIDLYHAHEYSLAIEEEEILPKKDIDETKKDEKPRLKPKRPKFVPWEPYKAAPSPDRKGEQPTDLPKLIPYHPPKEVTPKTDVAGQPTRQLVDGKKLKEANHSPLVPADERVVNLEKEVSDLNRQLDLERKLNSEMKSMFLSSLGDDLQAQVEALAGDKIQLGRRLEEYCEKIAMGNEEVDALLIDRDVWKCKFQAQSIRADELSSRIDYLLNLLRVAQRYIMKWSKQPNGSTSLPREVMDFAKIDIQKLYLRSPCDPKVIRAGPNYSNVTVTCCRGCAGREIKLL